MTRSGITFIRYAQNRKIAKPNTKQFWSYLKIKKQDSQGVTPLRKDDGFLYSDIEIKAEILNDQFTLYIPGKI